jgi:tetratricopeptide (TPR) repeat protein
VRITAQLVDGRSDEHLWAHSFDRELEDVLAVLSEVARSIATQIQVVLTPEQQRLLARERPTAPEVLDLHLRAQHQLNRLSREGIEEALRLNTRAVELDPDFAQAHAGIAACYAIYCLMGYAPVSEVAPKAEAAALRSIELDSTLAAAYSALAHVKVWLEWDWPAAEVAFERALELDPGNAMTRHGYADLLTAVGRPAEGLRQVDIGRRYDPLSRLANTVYVGHLVLARRYPEVLDELEPLRERFGLSRCRYWGWEFDALWYPGRREEALAVLRECWAKGDPALSAAVDEGVQQAGPTGALEVVARELARRVPEGRADATDVARYLATAGDVDGALDWLDTAVEERIPLMMHVIAHPDVDCLRDHPRFRELLRRMNLPPEAVAFWARRPVPGQEY